MKRFLKSLAVAFALAGSSMIAMAGDVHTDYDHTIKFSQYKTYSWGKVQTTDPFYVSRIQQAVNERMQSKGWQLQPTGGSVTVFATDNIHNQQEVQTMYDNLGAGWGWGWGWGGWSWCCGWAGPTLGPSTETSTTIDQPVASLVIDLFDAGNKKLLWRGLATEDLSSQANKNTKIVDNDIHSMFKDFPKAGK
ncbi:DUF4136 domain-containing protein [Terracidiphilus sp.]|uniref:DUF4136 domain-containing protein n=1 Tax=Terracidiphilus sp. TaxID=1964191 RepID=UPI003C26FD65